MTGSVHRQWRMPSAPARRGRRVGLGAAAVGLPLLTAVLGALRDTLTLPSDLLLFLLAVFGIALVGDLVSALIAAVASVGLIAYFLTPPLHTFAVADPDHVVALVVFVAVAVVTSGLVDALHRRTAQAHQLAKVAALAEPALEADRTRTALMRAVSHDLRSPLASAKAAVEGLQSPGVSWTEEQRADLLGTARTSLDRLTSLVENLLDMSRLQAGALSVFPRAVAIEDVVAHTVREFDADGIHVGLDVPDDLPEVTADPPLLERVLANLVSNAVRFSPAGMPPTVTASADGDRVLVRVIDHGPGVPAEHREEIFEPFQRRGDTDNTTGLGLGLALARGLTAAMGGTLTTEETAGGGLTMVVSLAASPAEVGVVPPGSREQAGTTGYGRGDGLVEQAGASGDGVGDGRELL